MPREDYEERQEQRRERLKGRAERLRREAEAKRKASDNAVAGIPMGQPILVGHHSEQRHRNALERAQNAMFKSVELNQAAGDADYRARCVGQVGVSCDDPEAIAKLQAKLDRMVEANEAAKLANKIYRKMKPATDPEWAAYRAALVAADFTESLALSMTSTAIQAMAPGYSWVKSPFASNAANIRRYRERIETLRKEFARAEESGGEEKTIYESDVCRVVECPELNRVQIHLKVRISKADFKTVRGRGFRWSRNDECFSRHNNSGGRFQAVQVAQYLTPEE